MRVLISNDDGINAAGMRTLAKTLAEKGNEVYIIAPDKEQSAMGHALTLHTPLRVQEIEIDFPVAKAWKTTGTPGDCVKIGISSILEEKPDIVISGINHGPNLGGDIIYSGTVSAAMEGAMLGLPSIAVSLTNDNAREGDFDYAAQFVASFLSQMRDFSHPKKTVLNINIPAIPPNEINGISITKLGTRMYTDTYEKRVDPRGRTYYWLAGEIIKQDEDANTDIVAIRDNRISITPITFEITNEKLMEELKKFFCGDSCDWY